MQLKYDKSIRRKVITIELETTNFSTRENLAIKKFGEPVIKLEKMYGDFSVSVERRIKTGFKVRVRFDGTEDFEAAVSAANQFFEEIQDLIRDELESLMDKLIEAEANFESGSGLVDITI